MSERPILLVGCRDQIEAKRMYVAAMEVIDDPVGTSWIIRVASGGDNAPQWQYKVRSMKSRLEVRALEG